jgi:uncharacterized protein (TIGR02302 family)
MQTDQSPAVMAEAVTADRGADPLATRIRLACAAIAWERLWLALWPAMALIGLFAVIALFDILPALPAWLHAAVLVVFVGLIGWSLWRARGVFALPDPEAGRRRLEVASGMIHRPLFALRDTLAGGANDPIAQSLWTVHRERMRAALRQVRIGWPSPGLPARDPWALRAALVLLLVVGVGIAGTDSGWRLARALVPGSGAPPIPPGSLDLWITPPAYTGLPPLLPRAAEGDAAAAIAVPTGSALLAQVTGGRGTPHLVIDDKDTAFSGVDNNAASAGGNAAASWRVGTTLTAGSKLAIKQGRTTLGSWTVNVIPDQPPTIEFQAKPATGQRAALRLQFKAHDDYGLASAKATIRRPEGTPEDAPGDPIDIPLTLSQQNAKDATGSTYQDLTAHPWAGLPVVIQLQATDAINQIGKSDTIAMTLPERHFQNAVAHAIVEQRKVLVAKPAERELVGRALQAIASVPKQYGEDSVVFLALTTAAARLHRDPSAAGTKAVEELMWDTALRLEDGRLSTTARDLRALQQKLQDALANNAPDQEIERLIQELQQAINRYLQAMMENAQQHPEQMQPMDRNAMRLNSLDLQKLLDQARQMARTGARDAAKDLLARLQDLLENLKAGRPMMGQQQGNSPGQQMMQGLQQLMQRQQSLLDRTFRQSQQGRPGMRGMPGQQGQQGQPGQGQPGMQGQPGQQPGDMQGDGGGAGEQEALRRQLGEMMRQMGEMMGNIPGGMGRAERAMRESGEALENGAPGRSLRPQMEALDQLRNAAREMAQQMAEQFGQGEGTDDAFGDNSPQQPSRDPAGRPVNGLGGLDGRDVTIPEASEVQRSREILDELLRRSGERFRPTLERDYLDRLLKRF